MQRKEQLDRYKGDLLWRIAQGVYGNENMIPYSEHMDIVDGKTTYKTIREKVNDQAMTLIGMFTRKD